MSRIRWFRFKEMQVAVASARYVTIALAAALHGYSVEAIETKIARGVWTEGREYRRAPDGRILVDMRGVAEVISKRIFRIKPPYCGSSCS